MIRDIITIDEEKCNGCGVCVSACHEGALAMVDGKARLISDSYCDGLGACLPECPTGAISIQKREADDFCLPEGHPAAAHAAAHGSAHNQAPTSQAAPAPEAKPASPASTADAPHAHGFGGCPGSRSRTLRSAAPQAAAPQAAAPAARTESAPQDAPAARQESELMQWPVQIKLVPVNAPYFRDARLLIAADCTAYAHPTFHRDFMRGRVTLIGCPKLDAGSYVEKLTEIFRVNSIKSIMVARMEVPCCGGLEMAVRQALLNSGKMIPWQVVTIGTDGTVLED